MKYILYCSNFVYSHKLSLSDLSQNIKLELNWIMELSGTPTDR